MFIPPVGYPGMWPDPALYQTPYPAYPYYQQPQPQHNPYLPPQPTPTPSYPAPQPFDYPAQAAQAEYLQQQPDNSQLAIKTEPQNQFPNVAQNYAISASNGRSAPASTTPGVWTCVSCGTENVAKRMLCRLCYRARTDGMFNIDNYLISFAEALKKKDFNLVDLFCADLQISGFDDMECVQNVRKVIAAQSITSPQYLFIYEAFRDIPPQTLTSSQSAKVAKYQKVLQVSLSLPPPSGRTSKKEAHGSKPPPPRHGLENDRDSRDRSGPTLNKRSRDWHQTEFHVPRNGKEPVFTTYLPPIVDDRSKDLKAGRPPPPPPRPGKPTPSRPSSSSEWQTISLPPILPDDLPDDPLHAHPHDRPHARLPYDRHDHPPYERLHDRSHDRPYDRLYDRYDRYDRSYDRPYDRAYDRPYDRSYDRPHDRPHDRPPQDRPSQHRPPSQDRPPQDRPSQDRPPQDRPSQDRPSQERPSQERPQDGPAQDQQPSHDRPSVQNQPQNSPPQDCPTQDRPTQEPPQEHPKRD